MKNIVETAIESGNFKTLIHTLHETGLADSLNSDGPYTVFAPTDDAFSKIPSGIIEDLLMDKEKLTEFITNHVVEKKVMIDDVKKIKNAKTVNGKEIIIDSSKGIKIDKANIVKSNIEYSNGVIHIIDEVLIS